MLDERTLQALQANYRPIDIPQQPPQQQGTRGRGGPLTAFISEAGGIGGAIKGGAAGLAMGGPLGALIGAGIGGFGGGTLGKLVENKIRDDEFRPGEALREGAIEGAFSVGPVRALKGVRGALGAARAGSSLTEGAGRAIATPLFNISGRTGSKLEQAGGRLMGSQADLTRAEVRKLQTPPSKVFNNLQKRTGVSNMDDLYEISRNVTGADGALSELTRNAIGNSRGVDISDLRKVTEGLLTDKGAMLTPAVRKNITEQVKNSVVRAYGGAAGSLSTRANPNIAFDVARDFESQAAQLLQGFSVSAADRQLASVYRNLADTIKDRLFASEGVKEGLQLASPAAAEALRSFARQSRGKIAQAYNKLADEVAGVKSVKDLRSLQKDFVDLQKVADASAQATAGAAQRLGGNVQGLGRIAQRPLNAVALPLDAASPNVGAALANAGRRIQGGVTQGADVLGRQTARGALTGAGVNATVNQANETPISLEDALMGDFGQLSAQGLPTQDLDIPEQTSPFSRENILEAMLIDLQETGGKNFAQIQALYEFANPQQGSGVSPNQERALMQMSNAESLIDNLEGAFNDAGGAKGRVGGAVSGAAARVGLDSPTAAYNAIRQSAVASIARAFGETGNLSDRDIQRVIVALPNITDTREEAARKFAFLRQQLRAAQQNAMSTPGATSGGGLEDALLSMQGGL